MKNTFLDDWLNILRNCNYDNTYKMAWAKAITEISLEVDFTKNNDRFIEITLEQIAKKVIKYYWNQTIFFNLVQGSNPLKPPVILSLTKELIQMYQANTQSFQPIRFEKVNFTQTLGIKYNAIIEKVIKALKADVSYRFLNLEGKKLEDIYRYNKNDDSLFMSIANLKVLKENSDIIFETINYRWALILETFNTTPRICKKVKIIDDKIIRRKPLNSFMKYLDLDNCDHVCFICGRNIEDNDLSIDHVIPWSYLYSDDLWNLVYTHRGCNSIKSNAIPNEAVIRRLEDRNEQLLSIVERSCKDKYTEELKNAVEKNYVRKFWISCQG